MEENLIYLLGETLLLELEDVENVTYPIGAAEPDKLILTMRGKKFEVLMVAV